MHYYGGLLDKSWLAWREAVELAELERGGGAMRHLVYSRWGGASRCMGGGGGAACGAGAGWWGQGP